MPCRQAKRLARNQQKAEKSKNALGSPASEKVKKGKKKAAADPAEAQEGAGPAKKATKRAKKESKKQKAAQATADQAAEQPIKKEVEEATEATPALVRTPSYIPSSVCTSFTHATLLLKEM